MVIPDKGIWSHSVARFDNTRVDRMSKTLILVGVACSLFDYIGKFSAWLRS